MHLIQYFLTKSKYFKGNAQFIFLCNPQKSGASRWCITFLQLTQKVLTKDIFHWLELIPEILSFLQIFSVRKTTTPLFQYFRNSTRISTKNQICGIIWAFKSKLQIIHVAIYIALFLPDSNNCFFICLYIPVSLYYSLILLVFLFSPSLSLSFRHQTYSTLYDV